MSAVTVEQDKKAQWLAWGNELVPGFLQKAEDNFGARSRDWIFKGVIFQENGPHIFFPSSAAGNEIQIALNPDTVGYPDQFVYQLSHEVIHLLAPNSNPPAPMLEEGLAVYFSLHFPRFRSADFVDKNIALFADKDGPKNYADAYNLYTTLISTDPDAVKKLRVEVPEFYNITPEHVTKTLKVSKDFAEALCERRQMR